MPHLVILYSGNLEGAADFDELCRVLADEMLKARDEKGHHVFPPGGVRVFAYPATHYAISDGKRDYAFAYLNLRMGRGRSAPVQAAAGEKLLGIARTFLEPLLNERLLGVTLQIDEGQEVFSGRFGNIHPLFRDP
jgi:5-carboxymethyl-2-hydroxymuconate isomerase